LLSTRWGAAKEAEPSAASKFLLGAVSPPEALTLGGWVRQGYIWNVVDGKLVDHRELQMRTSLAAALRLGPLRAEGELGYASANSQTQLAQVTHNQDGANLVSRQHWVGLAFADDAGLVRAGRINIPFGLRNPEHTSFVRAATLTDINQDQQDGVAVSITKDSWRAEVMAILGNYSLRPDAFRERGLAGYAEAALSSTVAVGVSALATRADSALDTRAPALRQAYGLTARAALWKPLVLTAEIDALLSSLLGRGIVHTGLAGWLQEDLEVLQGLHLISALERLSPTDGSAAQLGWWGGLEWFPYPHLDVRADVIRNSSMSSPTTNTFLIQVNLYL